MAIGTLGRKIIFEVSDDYMFTFKDMTREITSRWANHEPQGVKPKPEFLGPGLQSSSLTITLSSALGVRPRTVLEEIEPHGKHCLEKPVQIPRHYVAVDQRL